MKWLLDDLSNNTMKKRYQSNINTAENIRKFLMLGTPNNGEVDLNILSKIFKDRAGNQVWTTVKQLRPDD